MDRIQRQRRSRADAENDPLVTCSVPMRASDQAALRALARIKGASSLGAYARSILVGVVEAEKPALAG